MLHHRTFYLGIGRLLALGCVVALRSCRFIASLPPPTQAFFSFSGCDKGHSQPWPPGVGWCGCGRKPPIMDTATGILRQEHDAILRMLEVAEAVARQLDRGEDVPAETLAGLLECFRLFADRCHHGKEEDLLFPLLEKKGLPRAGGPIGVMLGGDEDGRALVG